MRSRLLLAILVAAPLAAYLFGQAGNNRAVHNAGEAGQSPLVESITTITDNGGRLDWSSARNLIAFDRLNDRDFYEIWTMRPDGSDQQCLTCDKPGAPPKHKGNPAWYPSGRYIVFQAQNNYRGLGRITDYFANPGSGINNDLWIMDSEGRQYWQLTHEPPRIGGVLHPHFSHDGKYLLWSERFEARGGKFGTWRIKIARFSLDNGVPSIDDERELTPGEHKEFYETHGFTRDDQGILFSGNLNGQSLTGDDLYLYNLHTNQLKDLTNAPEEWDEHAQMSPSGRKIVWMTNRDLAKSSDFYAVKSDFWIMNADGSGQQRVTYFNDPQSKEYIPGGVACADSDWSPDGRSLAGTLLQDIRRGKSRIVMIRFRTPQ